jgi:sugar transferase (PEP-CTERM/EpsH1 system associated)
VRVIHLLYSLGVGGMEMGVQKLLLGLDRARVDSSVCSLTPRDFGPTGWPTDTRVHALSRRAGNDVALVPKLYRLFCRERPDIVHTHAWGTLLEGVVAARAARVPILVHGEHGTLETRDRNIWIQRLVWRRVDRVLAVSDALADRMAATIDFPLSRITVIRNGVDLERFGRHSRDAARRALGVTPSAFVVGTVGRLVQVKDQRLLIGAAHTLAQRGVPLQVIIVGDGPLRSELLDQIDRLGVQPHVRLLGSRDDVPELMAAFDVFALPSQSEGLSNTVLEAMASGLPVVATRVGGNPEVVQPGTTGLLVPPGDETELAGAIAALYRDPDLRRRMALAARHRAQSAFSLSGMFERYTELYCTAVESHRMRRAGETPEHAQSDAALSLGPNR